jgi:diaminopimelate epimerase
MRGLAFEKYEGLGNDFLVVQTDALAEPVSADLARDLCDRRRGVGGDGVLVVAPGEAGAGAIASMKVHNADGSVPEMCGNGLRCVALALVRRGVARMDAPFVVSTDAGPRTCVVTAKSGSVAPAGSEISEISALSEVEVEVEMGFARSTGTVEVTVGGRKPRWLTLDAVSTGNPHAVFFGDLSAEEIDRIGHEVSTHDVFPGGVNAGFARLTEGAIDLVVWERGVGKTLACGTGACAAVFAACTRGDLPFGQATKVRLPGGELSVTASKDGRIQMRGPARFVFGGETS